jgi:creatinine amidohydrolase
MKRLKMLLLASALAATMAQGAWAQIGSVSGSVYMDEMTWMEINDRLKGGTTVLLIPTGGVQQAGPHMATGAHFQVMRYTSGEIARRLGGALVAPIIPYVPAGRVNPPEGNMRFAGTFSLSDATYGALLEEVARSGKQHGFRMICFLGEDAGAQGVMAQVAAKLGREWITDGVRVVHVSAYAAGQGQDEWTDTMPQRIHGASAPAGHIETSELMSVDASSVRANMLAARTERDFKLTGATGDTTMATAALGRKYLSLKIESAVRQIQNASSNAKK